MKYLSLILLINLINLPIYAGGAEGSGGSDYFKPVRAWFLSQDPTKHIKACFKTAPNFGVSEQELGGMVLKAFKTWGDYIETKRLTAHLPPNSLRIASQVDLYPMCEGGEDLEFYFGVDDPKVLRAIVKYFKPFGFAELNEEKEVQADWSPGFIWISHNGFVSKEKNIPTWQTSKEALYALILHEVGHVFGSGHVDDTVMTVHLSEFLTIDTDPKTPQTWISSYNRIDSILELVPCLECSVSFKAPRQFDNSSFIPGNDDLSNSFRLLTGRDPAEPLSATFSGSIQNQTEVIFTDSNGTYRFPIKVSTLLATKKDSVRLFNGLGGKYFTSLGVAYYGEIQPLSGAPISISINFNMDRRKLAVIPLGFEMNPKPFFVAAP